jgi:hypothetical protein
MTADRFNWKEMAQLVGGVAAVALIQVGLLFPDTHDFVGSGLVMMLFGAIYGGDRRRHDQRVREATALVKDGVTRPSELCTPVRLVERRSSGSLIHPRFAPRTHARNPSSASDEVPIECAKRRVSMSQRRGQRRPTHPPAMQRSTSVNRYRLGDHLRRAPCRPACRSTPALPRHRR